MKATARFPLGLSRFLAPLGLALAAVPSLGAQEAPADGFATQALPHPGSDLFRQSDRLSDERTVVLDGASIDLYDAGGFLEQNLASLPGPVFASFVRISPDDSVALVGESSSNMIYRVDLPGGTLTPVASLIGNYDAAFEDDDTVIVSATASGFGLGNELWRIELDTPAATLVAEIPGASGPVAFDSAGNLVYATASDAFPAPPAFTEILRFDQGLLASGPFPLDETDATVLTSGFEPIGSLAVDPASDQVYMAENDSTTGVSRILQLGSSPGSSPTLLTTTPGNFLGSLRFHGGAGAATYQAYQPTGGGTLTYLTTDFATTLARHAVEPLRPAAIVTGPGATGIGPFQLVLLDGPPNGFGAFYYCPGALFQTPEPVYLGLGVPLFLGLDLPTSSFLQFFSLDASGDLVSPGFNSGFPSLAGQMILLNPDFSLAGSSTGVFL